MSVELQTERLRLRQFRESDHHELSRQHADPELTRYLGGPLTSADSWKWLLSMLGHWQLRGYGYFALEEKQSQVLCGAAGLIMHFDWPEMELGWRVFPSLQGRGYATEAARRVREYAFAELGATTLVSYVVPENTKSARVAERLGAEPDGTIHLRGETAAVYRHPHPIN